MNVESNVKKVLFFIESLAGGGAEKVLTDIVCNLNSEKFDVTVCTITDEDIYQKKVAKACKYVTFLNKKEYRAGGVKKVLFWLKMKFIYMFPSAMVYRLFVHEKYDVEIAFVEGFATKFIAASLNKKSKKVAWVHTDMQKNTYADSYYKSIRQHRSIYKNYQKIVCVSQSVRNAFQKKFGIWDNISVQYNPVDECKIRRISKEKCSLVKTRKLLLGTVGRLENQKGCRRLLECIKEVRSQSKEFEVWIIGDGSQRKELQKYIDKNNLVDTVTLVGFQENPYKYLKCCDAFICSSYVEGFSTAATESLILGKPIFTVKCAGMEELIGDSKCGKIVENTDENLTELISDLVNKRYDLKRYQEAALKRGEKFKLQYRIVEIEDLLSDL